MVKINWTQLGILWCIFVFTVSKRVPELLMLTFNQILLLQFANKQPEHPAAANQHGLTQFI